MDSLAGLMPDRVVVDAWSTISEIGGWARVSPGLLTAFLAELGDPALEDIRPMAAVPLDELKEVLLNLQVSTQGGAVRGVSSIEKGALNLLIGGVRHRYGREPVDLLAATPPPPPCSLLSGRGLPLGRVVRRLSLRRLKSRR